MRKLDFKSIDWLSPKPSPERLIAGVAVVALLGGGFLIGREAQTPKPATPAQEAAPAPGEALAATAPARGPGPVLLTPVANQHCKSFAPEGWRLADQDQSGTVFTLKSADGVQTASYAGLAVSAAHVAGVYGQQYRDPRTFTLYAAGLLAGEPATVSGPAETVGPYQALPLAFAGHSGWALIHTFRVPDPGGYGLIMRIAIGAKDAKSLGVAGGVAAAATCQAVLHPSTGPVYRAPRETHGAGRSASGGEDSTLAGTYNAQLGTGWAHDSLGRNYNVDVVRDWDDNGPDGPGFYVPVGGTREKLVGGIG